MTRVLPELALVYLHNLSLQFEGLFGEQLKVLDVVRRMLLWVVIPELRCRMNQTQTTLCFRTTKEGGFTEVGSQFFLAF